MKQPAPYTSDLTACYDGAARSTYTLSSRECWLTIGCRECGAVHDFAGRKSCAPAPHPCPLFR
jgi:hypothetical protein